MRAHFLFSTSLLWCSLFVLVSVLLSPWTVRFACFMIGIIFCPLTSIAVLIMESSFFHLDYNLRLLFRLSLSLLDL